MQHAVASNDRIIVALDVSTHDEAVDLVGKLENVSFFKVGLLLLLAGNLSGLLKRLREERDDGKVFIDLKIAGDIGNTITSFVQRADHLGVRFISLVEAAERSITEHTLDAGRGARSDSGFPKFLMVPLLSSIASPEVEPAGGVDAYIVERGRAMLQAGCDGLVVSGTAIGACRHAFPDTTLVSPGIRPVWTTSDDHARFTTPADAIRQGADYLVVGRPVLRAAQPREAAQRIIDEIEDASAPS